VDIRGLLTKWIDILADLAVELQAGYQNRQTVNVTRDGDEFVLKKAAGAEGDIIATIKANDTISRQTAESLRKCVIAFELSPKQVITRHLSVPAQARDFLSGIVRNQLDRLSPWPEVQILYAADAKSNDVNPALLDVSLLIALKTDVERACEDLKSIGLSIERVTAKPESEKKVSQVVLWTNPSSASQRMVSVMPRLIGAGVATAVAVSVGISLWAYSSTSAILSDQDEVVSRIARLTKPVRTLDKREDLSRLNSQQRAWAYKEEAAPSVFILEALSRALPDSAYLTELHFENSTLRLFGLTSDAPSLIAPLEQSRYFSDVHFFAPTTKGPGNDLYRFFVESSIKTRLAMIGEERQ